MLLASRGWVDPCLEELQSSASFTSDETAEKDGKEIWAHARSY